MGSHITNENGYDKANVKIELNMEGKMQILKYKLLN